jgi:hypothetical protein
VFRRAYTSSPSRRHRLISGNAHNAVPLLVYSLPLSLFLSTLILNRGTGTYTTGISDQEARPREQAVHLARRREGRHGVEEGADEQDRGAG